MKIKKTTFGELKRGDRFALSAGAFESGTDDYMNIKVDPAVLWEGEMVIHRIYPSTPTLRAVAIVSLAGLGLLATLLAMVVLRRRRIASSGRSAAPS